MSLKHLGIGALVAGAVLGVLAFAGIHLGASSFGSTGNAAETYYNSQWLVGGNQIGPTGTLNANSQFGTCNLIGGTAGISASTTAQFDCAVTGIKPGDLIVGEASANEAVNAAGNVPIVGAEASTTAGYITFVLYNQTGAATSSLGAQVTNGVEYATWR